MPEPAFVSKLLILNGKTVKSCHIVLPDLPKPSPAILYSGSFYSYVRLYSTIEMAERAAERLRVRGNAVLLTQVRRGLILWVLEPDAQLVRASKP